MVLCQAPYTISLSGCKNRGRILAPNDSQRKLTAKQAAHKTTVQPYMLQFLSVALPVPIRDTFTYRHSYADQPSPQPEHAQKIAPPAIGARVLVPFGRRELIGIITGIETSSNIPDEKLKDVLEIIDDKALMPEELQSLCHWASNYYHHPIGEVLSAAIPQRFRDGKAPTTTKTYIHTQEGKGLPENALARAKKQQAIHQHLLKHKSLDEQELDSHGFTKVTIKALIEKNIVTSVTLTLQPDKSATPSDILKEAPKTPSDEQNNALTAIRYHEYNCYLLQGSTGSGKTEVYLQTIARVLQAGQQALVLIPEIGLSPQTIARFRERFNTPIVELHSNIAEGLRSQNWQDAKSGKAKIIIGTRLASLTPFSDLGIIVIDEEHDQSYKQQDGFKYSARDLCIYRAHTQNIPIILGSATPSLESLHNANTGKYKKLVMHQRAGNANPPIITIIDLKNQKIESGLSQQSLEQIRRTIEQNEQALIFLNRRGYAPVLVCHSCGWNAQCQSCDAQMTLHQQPRHLLCHYCERRKPIPNSCPNCGQFELKTSGYGTEQLEQALSALFPQTEVIRVDRDSTQRKDSFEQKLQIANENKACIFVGTQMLAKGHHLPNLTLVIVLDADQGLMSPDFRGLEMMGQLITQVAGRAGRENKLGHVLVQSHRPDHPLLNLLLDKGYNSYAKQLLHIRRSALLPPFQYAATFKAESKRAESCIEFLNIVRASLQDVGTTEQLKTVGPIPAQQEKVNNKYRYSYSVFSSSRQRLQNILAKAIKEIDQQALSKRTRWSLTVDPTSLG